jgi:hypothetical protein
MLEPAYTVTLLRQNMAPQYQTFVRLSEAIRWLAGELEAADADQSYGEIRVDGKNVLWRRGNAEVASAFYLSNDLPPDDLVPVDEAAAVDDDNNDWERFYKYAG